MTGINWALISQEAMSQPSSQVSGAPESDDSQGLSLSGAPGDFDGTIKVFRLEGSVWKPLRELNRILLKDIMGGPFLLKINDLYVAGSEAVLAKLEDKKDKILSREYFEGPIKELVTAGCTRESMLDGSFQSFLSKKWAHEVFGGQFLTGRGERCLVKNAVHHQKSMLI